MSWYAVPLGPVAIAFAVGIALGPWAPSWLAWPVWALGFGGGAALVVTSRHRRAWIPLLIGVAAVGALRAAPPPLPSAHIARLPLPQTAVIEGRVAGEPTRFAADRLRLRLDTERVDAEARGGRIQVTVYGPSPPLVAGQQLRAEGRLHRAQGFRNPGGSDYADNLRREGIYVVASVRGDRIILLDHPQPSWPASVRRRAVDAIAGALPPASAALLSGLLLGIRSELPAEIDEGFRRAGVYHVLAVSGFNVAIVASAVFALVKVARGGRRVAAVLALGAVVIFALIVGPEPSVLRATIMAVLVLAGLLLERDAHVVNSLALAAIIILAVRPGDLLDPGFQLSFAATGGIITAPLPRGPLLASVAVTLAAELAVLPITLSHFNQVSTVGLLSNLAVVPLAALATVLGLAAVGAAFVVPAVAAVAFDALWPVLIVLRAVVAFAAAIPGALVHLPAPPGLAVVSYATALALALAWWRTRGDEPRRARIFSGTALGLLALAVTIEAWPIVRPPDGRLRLTVLDVGQGDALVVEAPDGRTVLIDAGAGGPQRLDVGARVIAPFLWNRSILRLAALVTTHSDADHAGGTGAVRRLFTVKDEWSGDRAGAQRYLGGVLVSVLSPAAATRPEGAAPDRNDDALVLRLEYGRAAFLLTSDIGAATERALLARKVPLGATVLKVAHHGSRTSTTPEFLRAVQPAIAVISVGPRNPYGHPHPRTLAALETAGARVVRTDRDGAVILETDGRTLTLRTWATGRVERHCLDPETMC